METVIKIRKTLRNTYEIVQNKYVCFQEGHFFLEISEAVWMKEKKKIHYFNDVSELAICIYLVLICEYKNKQEINSVTSWAQKYVF